MLSCVGLVHTVARAPSVSLLQALGPPCLLNASRLPQLWLCLLFIRNSFISKAFNGQFKYYLLMQEIVEKSAFPL